MNTFLPYSDFIKSAKCLDYKRLGKQRVEAWQIYNVLKQGEYKICSACKGSRKPTKIQFKGRYGKLIDFCLVCKGTGKIKTAWYNHPIVQMWKGYEPALLTYGIEICKEWIKRGYKDTMLLRFFKEWIKFPSQYLYFLPLPKWLGNKEFHSAMRSNLLRKDKKYYSQFGWKEKDNLPYIWFKE